MLMVKQDVWDYLRNLPNHIKDNINISLDKLEDLENGNYFPFKTCEGHYFIPVLNANGDVCSCMYHPNDDRFVFGNIYKNTLEEIWYSDKRKEAIENIRSLDYCKECQVCCKPTEVNKLIDYIKTPDKRLDVNFI